MWGNTQEQRKKKAQQKAQQELKIIAKWYQSMCIFKLDAKIEKGSQQNILAYVHYIPGGLKNKKM